MGKTARKMALIGLDSATLDLLERFGDQGRLPNVSRLMQNGVTFEAFPALPAGTAMNWTTIVTGAYVGTHGVTAMTLHRPGGPLDKLESAFFSYECKAERLWEVGDRCGKRSILLKYPCSWPPTVKNGVQVEGFAEPDWNIFALAPRMCYANYPLPSCRKGAACPWPGGVPYANLIEPEPATGWSKLPASHSAPLEVVLDFRPTQGEAKRFFALVIDTAGTGYDRVLFCSGRDAAAPASSLREGEWGSWVKSEFHTDEGVKEATFRLKLVELSGDAERINIYTSQVFPSTGWTRPESLSLDLVEKIGPFQELSSVTEPYCHRWVDAQTILEELEYQVDWLGRAASYLMSEYQWDLFFTQWHGIDHVDHKFLGGMDPKSNWYLPEKEELCTRMIAETYELADRYVGAILEQIGDDTLVVITSDHGHIPLRVDQRYFYRMNDRFAEEGLLSYEVDAATGERKVDWAGTKAYVAQSGYAYVNLKGREPHGIVSPGVEYGAVRNEVLRVIEGVRDSASGDYVFELVLKKENAEFLGLHGPRVGDVVFFQKAELSKPGPPVVRKPDEAFRGAANHHPFLHSPRFDLGSMRAVTIFSGPGIRKGVEGTRPINLVDIAPTVAHALGMPTPAQTEGRLLREIFE